MNKQELEDIAELMSIIQHSTPLHVQNFTVELNNGLYVNVSWYEDRYEVDRIDD